MRRRREPRLLAAASALAVVWLGAVAVRGATAVPTAAYPTTGCAADAPGSVVMAGVWIVVDGELAGRWGGGDLARARAAHVFGYAQRFFGVDSANNNTVTPVVSATLLKRLHADPEPTPPDGGNVTAWNETLGGAGAGGANLTAVGNVEYLMLRLYRARVTALDASSQAVGQAARGRMRRPPAERANARPARWCFPAGCAQFQVLPDASATLKTFCSWVHEQRLANPAVRLGRLVGRNECTMAAQDVRAPYNVIGTLSGTRPCRRSRRC